MRFRDTSFRGAVPIILGAVSSVGFAWSGVLTPLFLVPLGLIAFRPDRRAPWVSVVLVAMFHAAMAYFFSTHSSGIVSREYFSGAFYFTVTSFVFVWVVLQPGDSHRLKTAYRIVFAAIAASLAVIPIVFFINRDEEFMAMMREQMMSFISAIVDSVRADVVQHSLLERYFTVDAIISSTVSLFLRGFTVSIHIAFLFLSWRVVLFIASLKNPSLKRIGLFARFKVDFFLIWVVISALLAILLGLVVKIAPLEIVGWNLLVVCLMFYMAQGYGILLYNVSRPIFSRFFRLLVMFGVFFALIQPGINAVVVGLFVTLGIAENWLPLRRPIETEPPSTPGA